MALTDNTINYITAHNSELFALLKQLCQIPAPSLHEEKRAAFVLDYLKSFGADAFIDAANNVLCFVNGKNSNANSLITVFMAHTDTVFQETTPLPYFEDDTTIRCPGVGDDTIDLAMLLLCVKYITENMLLPNDNKRILFVANSAEEGLGNLKGTKAVFAEYGDKIEALYTFDGQYDAIVNKPVGSHRYKISVDTEGGHSYNSFGNKNAIKCISDILSDLYSIAIPNIPETKTTINVGTISGGTTINAIASHAEMLFEYRSDNSECLDIMYENLHSIIASHVNKGIAVKTELIGMRPCMKGVPYDKLDKMSKEVISVCQKHSGIPCRESSGSTDANIPMSMGIPAVCVGVFIGGKAHTYDEWLDKASVNIGTRICFETILRFFEC